MLPWLHEAIARDRTSRRHLGDCANCKETMSTETRRMMACGYEPTIDIARPWSPISLNAEWQGTEPTVCPGYTTSLPEVIEIGRARVHWDKGNLRDFCGDDPTEHMLIGIEILDSHIGAMQRWAMKNPKEG